MKKEGYYSSGSFAAKAHVTKKTLRYYDEHGFLKPSFVNENGARFYTEQDFQKMQQIQMLKYLGFSLEDIKEMTMKEARDESLLPALKFQTELLEERMEQMKLVHESLQQTTELLQKGKAVDWGKLMEAMACAYWSLAAETEAFGWRIGRRSLRRRRSRCPTNPKACSGRRKKPFQARGKYGLITR